MKFSASFVSALLCAGAALAAPTEELRAARREQARRVRHENRLARRDGRVRTSRPKADAKLNSVLAANATREVSYSTNWAGAVLISTGFTSATGTSVVPAASGGSSAAGSAWFGIDGDTCDNILQTGYDFYGDGTYDAWYEWYPYDFAGYFNIDISEGDSILMSVTATSKTAGKATLENLSTGKTVTHSYSGISSKYALCEYNAEWIVEDFEERDSSGSNCQNVPLADFDTVKFTSCSAVKSGSTVTLIGATVIDMITEDDDIVVTCSTSGSTVTCEHV
ncbi:hypothetical protein GQ53DRAFT_683116 [Thozetella sp. PMI_491]|nr:hypothetical protein GQ53DRAFT_683116 [Thozetella sp. PMI_491]